MIGRLSSTSFRTMHHVPDFLEPGDQRVYIRVDRSGGRSRLNQMVMSSPRADDDRSVVRVVETSIGAHGLRALDGLSG
jgi:hypothetical protein